jgi:predicted metalloendopeptidase
MNRPLLAASFVLGSVVAVACGSPPDPVTPPPATSAVSGPVAPPPPAGPKQVAVTLASVGLDANAIDKKADPCTDFYRFACGNWTDTTKIPADKPIYARGFSTIADRNEADLRQITEDARAGKISTPAGKKLGAFYGACMDEAAIEAGGTKALDPLRKVIRGVKDAKTLAIAVAALHDAGANVFFTFGATQDFKDAQRLIGEIDQAGLGLPDRDFYTRDDGKSKEILGKYEGHVTALSELGGHAAKETKTIAADVLRIETALAKVSQTNVQRRDVPAQYHKIDRDGVLGRSKSFAWTDYLAARSKGTTKDVKDINVTSLAFLDGLDAIVKTEKPEAIRRYLEWHLLSAYATTLGKKIDDERFRFVQVLTGQEKQRDRWKRCVEATDDAVGELLAQPFVEKRFDAESKAAAEQMIGALRAAFDENLAHLAWMDEPTKKKAYSKLKAIAFQIGYPVKWKSYEFDIDPKAYAQSSMAARQWDTARRLAKIGKPLDKNDWEMTPPQVNAYADPQKALMVFPAGILQPPFFSKAFSPAVNLGGIGMIIGHELTHHFDDQGAEFSETGNVEMWWSPDVKKKFDDKATCVADQYSAYEVMPGVKLDGRLTLGENIADVGGVKMAFAAYKRLRVNAAETQVADGFTEDQQFFLAYGQGWCTVVKDELARTLAQTDPHSAPRFRVNGAVSDVSMFAEAFHCAAGTTMRPKNACEVW